MLVKFLTESAWWACLSHSVGVYSIIRTALYLVAVYQQLLMLHCSVTLCLCVAVLSGSSECIEHSSSDDTAANVTPVRVACKYLVLSCEL